MAEVYSRFIKKSGIRVWYARCKYVEHGRRVCKPRSTGIADNGTAKNKGTAELAAADLERALALGQGRVANPTTLEQAITLMLKKKSVDGRSAKTLAHNGEKAVQLFEYFGSATALATIGDEKILAFSRHRLDIGRERTTVAHELLVMRQAYDAAKLPRPAFPKLIGETRGKPRERWLTMDEQRRLLLVVPTERRPVMMFYMRTGCRKSDPWKVQSDEWFWERRECRVRGTKTTLSDRTVVLDAELYAELWPRRHEPVMFLDWDETVAEDQLKRWSVRAGLGEISFNVLRHSYATHMARAKAPILWVAKTMGTSVKELERVYAHVSAGEHMHEMAAMMPALRSHHSDTDTAVKAAAADSGERYELPEIGLNRRVSAQPDDR